jgi:cell division septum initiation protein DivIVA
MDQTTFINTYIDITINSLQDYVKSNLQLQTQIKVNEFVIAEKDKVIASLTQQVNENKTAEDWKIKYESAETNYSAILSKLSHMNTLVSQIADMKNQILSKDAKIELLKKELDELKEPKKVINTRTKKSVEQPTDKTLDDF